MSGTVDQTRLRSFIERIERLEQDRQAIAEDLKEVFGEAKSAGYEIKALKEVIKLRKISENPKLRNKMEEEQYWIDAYKVALGIE